MNYQGMYLFLLNYEDVTRQHFKCLFDHFCIFTAISRYEGYFINCVKLYYSSVKKFGNGTSTRLSPKQLTAMAEYSAKIGKDLKTRVKKVQNGYSCRVMNYFF